MADPPDLTAIDEVHDLYRIDPSEFVEARAALVKQLRAEGRKDEAKAVVKLRKPSVASWALDQVAVDRPELIEAALVAGDALQAATTETLEGDATNLRPATDAERKAVAAVMDAATGHLPSLTADHRERMTATLRAAIGDEDVRAQLVAGLLATDHEPPPMGFAAAAASTDAPAKRTPPRGGTTKRAEGEAKRSAAAELAEPPVAEPTRPKRKVRRVGTPSSTKRRPVDEVEAKRRAKEVERLQAEEAERKRAEEERAKERERQQAALDAAAEKARTAADRLEEQARTAEAAARSAQEAADVARAEAEEASAAAEQAEAAAAAGPPD